MKYHDYYETLGIARSASKQEIQKAYRSLARKYHPDVNKDPAAEDKFKEISEAYEVLGDPEKRAKYDQFGAAWKQAQRGGEAPGFEDFFRGFTGRSANVEFDLGGGGFSSFFEQLFGGASGEPFGQTRSWSTRSYGPQGFGAGQAPFSQSGSDHRATLTVTLEEAARGGEREVQLTDPTNGTRKTLRVKVPAGIRPGQKIRLAGQGGGGVGGGPRGDLYLTVELAKHTQFEMDGERLRTVVEITPWEAALGCAAEVPTLDGPITVKIPEGTSSGSQIRLRGKGFPSAKKGQPAGDLYAEVKIVVPKKLTGSERELFERLAESSEFRPRSR